jgi:pimeloyl-ACP methyl ester carboxylesterase
MCPAVGLASAPDLYCLHPAPFSGLAFTQLMPHLAIDRRVFAPDYPAYGGSTRQDAAPSIAYYAAAIGAVVRDQSPGTSVDILGFHTGCLVAAELALIAAGNIRRIIMIDVPYFDAATRAATYRDNLVDYPLAADLDCLASAWERGVTRRIESQGLARSFDLFAELARSGGGMNAAFQAAASYDCASRFPLLVAPLTIIATQSPLLSASRAAALAVPQARLVERLDIARAVLDEAAAPIAAEVRRVLAAEG